MANRDHLSIEQTIEEKTAIHEHIEAPVRNAWRGSLSPDSVTKQSFDRRHSASYAAPASRRDSIRKSFDRTNLQMVPLDTTHVELSDDDMGKNSIDDIATSWFVWLVAFTASIAGALFGYDTGIISAVLVYLGNDLDGRPVSSGEKELITSLCSGGAFIGSIIAGLTCDKFGRKMAVYIGCALFTVGAILQAASYSIAQMAVGRLIVGFGVGSAAMV